jgi:molybdenum cofactor synthesis domain-containing protein
MRLEEARERMLAGLEPLPAESVPLEAALGRVLAADVAARLTLPRWDDSAMDGFAVRAVDVAGASAASPVRLRVVGEVAAGHVPSGSVEPGTAMRILTGAMLPAGADAVVPVEDTDAPAGVAALPERVAIRAAAAPGAHIRRAGSDLRAGTPILSAGRRLRPAHVALLAAAGHAEVAVHRRPRVGVLSTGDELVPPGAPLPPGGIPDSNGVGTAALAEAVGAIVERLGIARDDREDVLARLRIGLARTDVIVASGGVSVGAHDVVKDAFETVGRLELWRVAVQPGKPLAFGRAPSPEGSREVLFFGLPGNPVSSGVTFELFVRPVLRRLAGLHDPLGRSVVRARLLDAAHSSAGRRTFLRVTLARDPQEPTRWVARLAGGQGSHVLSGLAAADGLAVVPEEVAQVAEGAELDVIRIADEAD